MKINNLTEQQNIDAEKMGLEEHHANLYMIVADKNEYGGTWKSCTEKEGLNFNILAESYQVLTKL